MRRLIPAIAMLLVSAVMLSTASFAWFTMNEQVTASGMQIQAQASGSLIIDTEPLNYQSGNTSVDISTGNNKLKPVTYINGGWNKPSENVSVDVATGKGDITEWAAVDAGAGYYVEEELWIGSAGDTLLKQSITLDLAALVAYDTESTKAYAAAIYVVPQGTDGNWAAVAHTKAPDATIYIDDAHDRNTVTLTGTGNAGYTIPSIVGVGAQDTKTTGLKIVVRFFVDGNLDAVVDGEFEVDAQGNATTNPKLATKTVVTGVGYEEINTAETEFDPTEAYFVYDATSQKYVAAVTEGLTTWADGVEYFTQEITTGTSTYKYVNSEEVPSSGTSLELNIHAEEIVANPGT